ncbi:hypothetical protein CLOSYM_03995 [[Clostridium] symbiosum ATCC 14940]|uniref:Uncharacterized protein n=1 Tax=[Clostridium] symbiosum ATCC 14940 TaxID=411472 RepID=A0ABC9TT99_CLOSY|nr:hypothetical protein CLOSYM_03995 [[Clostridium] symbiosum ATCC 14940]
MLSAVWAAKGLTDTGPAGFRNRYTGCRNILASFLFNRKELC